MKHHPNTLFIGDLHQPFTHRDYLSFAKAKAAEIKAKRIVFIGDIVDHHALSYHEHDPDGLSPGAEYKRAQKRLQSWFKAFPEALVCVGNHDALVARKAHTAGLPSAFVKTLPEIYGTPAGWQFAFRHDLGFCQAIHGTNTSGPDAAFRSAVSARQNTVQGHVHGHAGIRFHASHRDILWGMFTGCGIDRTAYAFAYGKEDNNKPILGLASVVENGTVPQFHPMAL